MKINIYPIVSSLHEHDRINNETQKLLNELESISSHTFNICNIDDFYNADLSLILIQSGGSEQLFLKEFKKLKAPYYLLTYGHNNSLAASLEILSYLKDHNLVGEVLHGSNNYIATRIEKLINNDKTAKYRYGVIGKPSDWLISSNVNYQEAMDRLNVELIDIPISEVVENYKSIKFAFDHESNLIYDQKEIHKAERLHKALKMIKEKYNLNGLTIRCFSLLNKLKTTACLSLALFNSDNIVATCEGDVPTMLSMHLTNKLFNQVGFQANPSRIDVENKKMVLAHCTLPLSMCEQVGVNTHFESGIGVAIKGELKCDKVTIFKFSRNLKDYFVTTGTIIRNLNENNLCRTQIEVSIDSDIEYFLNRPYGNHHIIIYGDHKQEIIDYLEKK